MAGPVVTPHDATKTRVFRVAPRPFPGVTDLSVERPVETQAHRALLMAVEQEPRERDDRDERELPPGGEGWKHGKLEGQGVLES